MNNNKNTTVHGVTYTSTQAMHTRLAKLMDDNFILGESDGRVTEINALHEALNALNAEHAAKQLEIVKAKDREYAAWKSEQLRKAQQELNNLKAWDRKNVPADHRIDYEDNGRRRVAYYTTEDGFLKALIRLHSKSTVVIHFVD